MPTDNTIREYHFSAGNSNRGPVGFCATVRARCKAEAVDILSAALPCDAYETDINENDEQGRVVYLSVYFNPDAIKASQIDDINNIEPKLSIGTKLILIQEATKSDSGERIPAGSPAIISVQDKQKFDIEFLEQDGYTWSDFTTQVVRTHFIVTDTEGTTNA